MACNVGEEDNEGCEDDNGESGADKFFGRLAGRVKRLGDKRQRLVSPTLEDEEEVQDEEIREQFLGGFEQILDGKKDEHRRNGCCFMSELDFGRVFLYFSTSLINQINVSLI
uniref:Uncharacterized protein n=1 Tax=Meloidogyne enterolobii TaxID=390850 RepID=A0A6V7UZQ3_MELEN|nr:unnamed protein product [Meloidogyne enterolobii]